MGWLCHQKIKIRGVESNWMICPIGEVGLDQRLLKLEDKDGIHVLDANDPIEAGRLEYIGLKDTVLENKNKILKLTMIITITASIILIIL